ncbi:MAG: DNA polymerase III subunit delta, partial [Pirellulaceae bacterium]
MPSTLPVLEFLAVAEKPRPAGVCVLFGDEPFLKRLALKAIRALVVGPDAGEPVTAHDCQERMPEWRDVADELATVSLFGGGRPRLVILERADSFVTANRSRLEDYVARPKPSGVLMLDVDEWASNTKLYKAVDQSGLQIDCRPPQKQQGKNKVLDQGQIVRWIVGWGKTHHEVALASDAAALLLDLTGPAFGVLDQDLAKLALFVKPGQKITAEMVQQIVGGWRSKTTWDLVDAAVGGDAAEALVQLDRLLQAGEHPLALVGSISWSLRRYAAATRIFQRAERRGERMPLATALSQAGVRDWPLGTLSAAEQRLKQLGRHRGAKLYRWLLELDLSLKGTHAPDARARWALEQLI